MNLLYCKLCKLICKLGVLQKMYRNSIEPLCKFYRTPERQPAKFFLKVLPTVCQRTVRRKPNNRELQIARRGRRLRRNNVMLQLCACVYVNFTLQVEFYTGSRSFWRCGYNGNERQHMTSYNLFPCQSLYQKLKIRVAHVS